MRLWLEGGALVRKQQKAASKTSVASHGSSNTETGNPYTDADEFYVFMYDEADDKGNQAQLQMGRGGARGYKKGKTKMRRVLGFWCFSPGVGFKKI